MLYFISLKATSLDIKEVGKIAWKCQQQSAKNIVFNYVSSDAINYSVGIDEKHFYYVFMATLLNLLLYDDYLEILCYTLIP